MAKMGKGSAAWFLAATTGLDNPLKRQAGRPGCLSFSALLNNKQGATVFLYFIITTTIAVLGLLNSIEALTAHKADTNKNYLISFLLKNKCL